MFVSLSDVSFRDSIHLDSCVTGAKAIASSDEGSWALSAFDLTNRSLDVDAAMPGSMGFQSVAGASVGAIVTLRGPVRRSRYWASDVRHVSAACCRSASVIVTCISFSAAANVAGETAGPEPAPVPNVGGAPGVSGVDCELDDPDLLRQEAATSTAMGAVIRNWRRVFIRVDRFVTYFDFLVSTAVAITTLLLVVLIDSITGKTVLHLSSFSRLHEPQVHEQLRITSR